MFCFKKFFSDKYKCFVRKKFFQISLMIFLLKKLVIIYFGKKSVLLGGYKKFFFEKKVFLGTCKKLYG